MTFKIEERKIIQSMWRLPAYKRVNLQQNNSVSALFPAVTEQ